MHALLVACPLVQLVRDKASRASAVVGACRSSHAIHTAWTILDQDLGVVDLKVRGKWTLREHDSSGTKEQVGLLKGRRSDRDVRRARSLRSCQFSQGNSSEQLGLAVALRCA